MSDIILPDPFSGYRVDTLETDGKLRVAVRYSAGDDNPDGKSEFVALDCEINELGLLSRAECLWEAICRWYNSGGNWETLNSFVELARTRMFSCELPENVKLISMTDNGENFGYVFQVGAGVDCKYINWVEDEFAEVVDRADMETQLDEEGEGDVAGS